MSASTTLTSISVSGTPYPVTDYVIITTGMQRRGSSLDKSAFCSVYGDACTRQCARVKSQPRQTTCRLKNAMAETCSPACFCKNGMTETRLALSDVVAQQPAVSVVSVVATSTATVTDTQTITQTTALPSTSTTLITAYTPTTTTTVSTVTATVTTPTTISTSTSTSTGTAHTTPTTTTTTSVTSVIATSTTIYAVAPTGVIRASDNTDKLDYGYLVSIASLHLLHWRMAHTDSIRLFTLQKALTSHTVLVDDKASANTVILVRDPASGLYGFQDSLDNSLVGEGSNPDADKELGPGKYDCAFLEFTSSTQTAAGPATGSGNLFQEPAEKFIFRIKPLASDSSIELQPAWYNSATKSVAPEAYWVRSIIQTMGIQSRPVTSFLSRGMSS